MTFRMGYSCHCCPVTVTDQHSLWVARYGSGGVGLFEGSVSEQYPIEVS